MASLITQKPAGEPPFLVLPVLPGDTVPLSLDPSGIEAQIDSAGNLIIKSGETFYVLQGYVAAADEVPVVILADDGRTVDLEAVLASTPAGADLATEAGLPLAGSAEFGNA